MEEKKVRKRINYSVQFSYWQPIVSRLIRNIGCRELHRSK